jgi:predicted GNAT family acetyltransferase
MVKDVSEGVTITRSEHAASGRYVASIAGRDGNGELVYTRPQPDRVIATRTVVDDRLRGMGIASRLVDSLVTDARREGFRILPQCSFVRAQFERHPDWSDVFDD